MSAHLYNSVERIARHVAQQQTVCGVARVVETHPAGQNSMPANYAATIEMRDTGLVLPEVPIATGVIGFASVPALDEMVLVVFADADLNAPFIVGRIYNPDTLPPENTDGQLVFRTPPGQAQGDMNLVVEIDQPSVQLDMPGDLAVSLSEGQAQIRVGEMKLTLSSGGGGEALLEAGSASLRIKNGEAIEMAAPKIEIKSDTTFSLEASQIEIKGSATVDISGGVVNLN